MITKESIQKDLEPFAFAKGRPVIVHSSVKSVGEIEGGGETLLEALIEFFTEDSGLLCIPTHTWDSTVYDESDPHTCIGLLPTLAAAHSRRVRSEHPSHSVSVFGEGAEEFVRTEKYSDTPTSPHGCYGNLYRMDGYILLIGVGHNKNTFMHCVEEMMGVPRLTDEPLEFTVVRPDGSREKRGIRWFCEDGIGDVSTRFEKYEPAFRRHGCIVDGRIGNAPSQISSARKIKEVMELIRERSRGAELLSDTLPIAPEYYE